jgi:hypothetical protein
VSGKLKEPFSFGCRFTREKIADCWTEIQNAMATSILKYNQKWAQLYEVEVEHILILFS